jgi:hypothetical protein
MANKFPGRGDFSIPSALLDEHEWISDALIDGELGTVCTLIYPPTDSECPNCLFDPSTGRSANIYRTGGPIPFVNHTVCPWCGGEGRRSEPVTDSIRLRVYWGGMEVNAAMRQFTKLANFDSPAGLLFVIGYMNDLPKFERSDNILVNSAQTIDEWKCSRASESVPWGFRKNRYFACMLKRG